MKKPLIGVTCNYDFRDEVGRVNGQGAIGQDWNFVAADYIRSLEWRGHFRWSFLSLMMLPSGWFLKAAGWVVGQWRK